RLQLNEGTIWAGKRMDRNNPEGRAAIPVVRRLLAEGKLREAEELADKSIISKPRRMPPYQPLCDLTLRFAGHENVTAYQRDLNLDTAIARTSYRVGNTAYTREVFSSYPAQAIVIRLTASNRNKLSFTARLSREDAQAKADVPALTL